MDKRLSRISVVFLFLAAALFQMPAQGLAQGSEPETISSQELDHWLKEGKDFLLFDARDRQHYETSHIAGAILPFRQEYYQNLELYLLGVIPTPPDYGLDLAQAMKDYHKDKSIVTYCSDNCALSTTLQLKLKELGFKNVRVLKPGLDTWVSDGYPVEMDTSKNQKV